MRVSVTRKNILFTPDSSRVVARYFMSGDQRTKDLIARIMTLNEKEIFINLEQTLQEFSRRHRSISTIFLKHCENIRAIIEDMQINYSELSYERKLLIGSYCTMEYAIESAAFFNPSMIEDIDQSNLEKGEKRVIISFRATGEGHISSIVFRRGILDKNSDLRMMKNGNDIDKAEISHRMLFNKNRFLSIFGEMNDAEQDLYMSVLKDFPEEFEYSDLKNLLIRKIEDPKNSQQKIDAFKDMSSLLDSYYDVHFHRDSDISERVIYPISESEVRGIEDARFVRFMEDGHSDRIIATYTAYNGHSIIPKLITTEDFYTFRIVPLHGNGAQNKGMALFPRKIKGKFAMLARVDGVNNYLMYSNRIAEWNDPVLIQEPKYPWEFTQIGNCGSPLWTEEGWLIITHGVGAMRRYCIGASLFDLDDPTKEIGRIEEPLLSALEDEREGYVPNVVYSCGSIIHNNCLILPYAISDYSSTYSVVELAELLAEIKRKK